jgi:membrane associated rhomboid family serine protease
MTPARRAARARVYRTSAFWLSVIQISLVIVSLSFRGFAPYEVNFGLGPWVDTLDFLGAKNGAKIIRLREAWRLIVAIMLHNGLLHLATNLLMQVRASDIYRSEDGGKWR